MQSQIKILQNIVSRRGSSKVLTFSVPQVFLALSLFNESKYVSRSTLCRELHLGEGAVKTLLSHLREEQLIDSIISGSFLTSKGIGLAKKLLDVIPSQCIVKTCGAARGKFNHAVILKNHSKCIGNGMQQRDFAILYGASGATTLLFKQNQFYFPKENTICFKTDKGTESALISSLFPRDKDVVIIASADDPYVAKISAINSAIWTIATC